MSSFIDMAGQRFGRLLAVSPAHADNQRAGWRCVCTCGNTVVVVTNKLRSGYTKSCGCLRQRTGSEAARFRHGHASKDNALRTREYRTWAGMIDRCTNPNNAKYPRYGARGISVAPEWVDDFVVFLRHIGPSPGPGYSIDRIDNDKGYVPGNVRWSTPTEQARNTSANKIISARGVTLTQSEWAERTGIAAGTLHKRLRLGWSDERTVTQPLRKKLQ